MCPMHQRHATIGFLNVALVLITALMIVSPTVADDLCDYGSLATLEKTDQEFVLCTFTGMAGDTIRASCDGCYALVVRDPDGVRISDRINEVNERIETDVVLGMDGKYDITFFYNQATSMTLMISNERIETGWPITPETPKIAAGPSVDLCNNDTDSVYVEMVIESLIVVDPAASDEAGLIYGISVGEDSQTLGFGLNDDYSRQWTPNLETGEEVGAAQFTPIRRQILCGDTAFIMVVPFATDTLFRTKYEQFKEILYFPIEIAEDGIATYLPNQEWKFAGAYDYRIRMTINVTPA